MKNSEIENTLDELCGPITAIHVEPFEMGEGFLDLAARFSQQPGTVALVSGGELDCARHHLLGIWPWLSLKVQHRQVSLTFADRQVELKADPFEVLATIIRYFGLPRSQWSTPMAAGLMGYLSYDLKDTLEKLPRTCVDELRLPTLQMYAPSLVVVADQQTGRSHLLVPRHALGPDPAERVCRFKQAICQPVAASVGFQVDDAAMASNFSCTDYHQAVREILEYIAAGDIYQANMTQRFEAPFSGDAFALFRHLFERNPAPFFAFVQCGDHQIVSTSPERFLLQADNHVEARPIKGTRPRGDDPQEDAAMRHELETSVKDGAELAMIVDLLRNDIGKVCRPGSVQVREHKRLEAYENVYHLVSIVEGVLDQGQSSVDLIRAAFPGGSITGCPKVRAMEIIDELESCCRHVYCGSIGYIGFDRSLDLSIAIRTATVFNDTLRFSVGGGIVYDSDPVAEYKETLHKGRTLMAACRSAGPSDRSRSMVWFNGRLMPADHARVPVSDLGLQYGYGLFETIRVDRGRAPLMADHLERFNTSWRVLMPDPAPDLSWEEIVRRVVSANQLDHKCAAVKLLATRGSRSVPPWDHGLLVSARSYTHRLVGKPAPGLQLGTYPHARQSPLADYKTLNYLYYFKAGAWAAQKGWDEALILNPDGSVSETNSASLLLIDGQKVIRPASPAALPSVMAKALCRQLMAWGYSVESRVVTQDALLSASQVLAANALMGAVPVVALDGQTRPAGSDLWRRLNTALIPGWDQV